MKFTVWGINYSPEFTGIAPYNAAFCNHLHEHGHDVRMVTTFAYYPGWQKRREDRGRLYRTDNMDGVPVHRCWHYVPRRPRALTRILHEASFVAFSFLRLLVLPRPDVYVVVSPPLLLGAAAWVLSRIKRAPFAFHVQDLQPDAAVGLGMMKNGFLMRTLYRLESVAYAKAVRVSSICRGMIEALLRKGVPAWKVLKFPNGVSLPRADELPVPGLFRRRMGFAERDFLAVYSGNLGVKQGLDILIDAARLVRDPRIRLVICGEGGRRDHLAARIESLGLANTRLLALRPASEFREMLADADVALITQERGAGSFCLPSKLLANLAFAKPVLAVADETSELVSALKDGGFGTNVAPDCPETLARTLEALAGNPVQLGRWGKAGRRYVEGFEIGRILSDFEAQLVSMVRRKHLGQESAP